MARRRRITREFVPVAVAGGRRRMRATRDIEIELRRGATDDDDHLAARGGGRLRGLDARAAAVIRVDAVWLAVEPLDMRAGTEAALARVVRVFGAAHPHHAYLFANRRANRMKVLVHDGIGVWLAARRLNQGKFVWPKDAAAHAVADARRSSTRWCSACRGSASARPASSACSVDARNCRQLPIVPMRRRDVAARSRSVIATQQLDTSSTRSNCARCVPLR